MEDFSLDDILKGAKGDRRSKESKKQSKKLTLAQQVLGAIDEFDMLMQELHRPLTGEERNKLEGLLDEAPECAPGPEDEFIVEKLINILKMVSSAGGPMPELDLEEEISELFDGGISLEYVIFRLGMAYERLKAER